MKVVGLVLTCEPVQGKDKLKEITVDIGEGEPVTIITNAPNIQEGSKTVVATIGTELEINGETIELKKTNVGGRPSFGMVCDSKLCGWKGGAEGIAVQIPEDIPVGSPCPVSKPRMGGFEQKEEELSIKDKKALEKAAKKAAAKEKRAAKKEAKTE
ncbi:hypothetical protein HK103_000351 [Boothiomyces macroporosus]|uniref:tRNA-binding domain-containing protein n=1 Tax=Boothiomyces macroporosus TaxID=261099 RepID=A0AAD5Y186_9FUNG|nr:hypothetical protein HK103_000351 [Boothiomyces macroporosus]